jgi:hypothetical protein
MPRFQTVLAVVALGLSRAEAAPPVSAEPPKSVVIVNTPAQPVPVTAHIEPGVAGTPVVVQLEGTTFYTVPAGQRLIIEFFSVSAQTSHPTSEIQFGLGRLKLINGFTVQQFALPLQNSVFSSGTFVSQDAGGSTPARVYVDPGVAVGFSVDLLLTGGLGTGDVSVLGTFSGTLVPAS